MISRVFPVLSALWCWLLAATASAAEAEIVQAAADSSTEAVTGLSNVGPAMFVIALAGALLLTLFFRASATRVANLVTAKIGKRRIRRGLMQKSRDVLEDFILPGAYGGLTKIDHAILTSGGIICIQTKHYNGIVFGGPEEPQWTNVDGVQRRKFLNPMIQNEGRTKSTGRQSDRIHRQRAIHIAARKERHSCSRPEQLHRQVRFWTVQDQRLGCGLDDSQSGRTNRRRDTQGFERPAQLLVKTNNRI